MIDIYGIQNTSQLQANNISNAMIEIQDMLCIELLLLRGNSKRAEQVYRNHTGCTDYEARIVCRAKMLALTNAKLVDEGTT